MLPTEKHIKLRMALYYWLLGKNYDNSCKALTFAERFHTGLRKDGNTPEFSHQIEISHFVRTLPLSEQYLEQIITLSLLHDVKEDYGISDEELARNFGKQTAADVELLTKKFRGVMKSREEYFGALTGNLVPVLMKVSDRIHNIKTMVDVFTHEKQLQYIEEVETYFLPMLKKTKKQYPEEERAFENVKHVLLTQICLIKKIHRARNMRT